MSAHLPAVLARDIIRVDPRPLDDPPGYAVLVGTAPAGWYATAAAAGGAADALVAAVAEVIERGVRRHGERTGTGEALACYERARVLMLSSDCSLDLLMGRAASPRSAAFKVLRYVLDGVGMPATAAEPDDGDAPPVTLDRAACGAAATAGEE